MVDVDKLANILSRLGERDLAIAPIGCTRLRSPKSTCSRCEEVCPHGVISWEGGLSVDPILCDDCGQCASVCMNGVFSLTKKDPSTQLTTAFETAGLLEERAVATIVISCERHSGSLDSDQINPFLDIKVPCYGALDGSFFALAFSRSALLISLAPVDCTSCSRSKGQDLASSWIEKDSRICSGKIDSGIRRSRTTRDKPATQKETVSRRRFFSRLGAVVAGEDEKPPISLKKENILSQFLPEKQKRLIDSGGLGQWSSMFKAQVVQPNCDYCGQCYMLCPTGALTDYEETSQNGALEAGIAFNPPLCTGCLLCSDVCPKRVITLSELLGLEPEHVNASKLSTFPKFPCAKCGDPTPLIPLRPISEHGLKSQHVFCPTCENNSKADDVFSDFV